MGKTWFITGANSGFGRAWSDAALHRGDKVAATARNTTSLDDLVERFGDNVLPLQLDVTDRVKAIEAVNAAHAHFGRLDVVVNNAGYGHVGFVEELSEEEARAQLETNLFGALWVTQAAVTLMREQGSGHILQVSSLGGVLAFPSYGIYNASKWALEGLTEALAQEVAGFGIKTTLIEPGSFATQFSGTSASLSAPHPAYQHFRDAMAAQGEITTAVPVQRSAPAILALVDTEEPPLRLLLTSFAYDAAQATLQQRQTDWRQWEQTSRSTD